jgi:hypothetical protein
MQNVSTINARQTAVTVASIALAIYSPLTLLADLRERAKKGERFLDSSAFVTEKRLSTDVEAQDIVSLACCCAAKAIADAERSRQADNSAANRQKLANTIFSCARILRDITVTVRGRA